jgi:hypothetical protein
MGSSPIKSSLSFGVLLRLRLRTDCCPVVVAITGPCGYLRCEVVKDEVLYGWSDGWCTWWLTRFDEEKYY